MADLAEYAGKQAEAEPEKREWQRRRVTAQLLRLIVFLCPAGMAAAVGLSVSRAMAAPTGHAFFARVLIAAVASVATFLVVQRLGRRFLPLAVLLRLNLVFPDRAPSRFSVALRSTSVRKLEEWVREAQETDNAVVLAEKVVTLAAALNTHDRRTRGHCERTRALADLIAEELRLSHAEANEVRWGAFLHDIGKLVVPAEILNKASSPTAREWEILRSHPGEGARLVEPLRTFLSSGVDAVGSHHENYDGTGYPAGLSGEQLCLAARIVSVADAFEVMTAVRAYKRPMTMQAAREELARRSGTQFDPLVVRAFLNVSLGRLHWVLGIAAWIAEIPFLTVLPRLAAQFSTVAGGGTGIAPVGLPSVAAASLGAMVVMGHVDSSTAARAPHAHTLTVAADPFGVHPPPTPGPAHLVPPAGQVVPSVPSLAGISSAAVAGEGRIPVVGGTVPNEIPVNGVAPTPLPEAAVTVGPVGATAGPAGVSVSAGSTVPAIDQAVAKVVEEVQGIVNGEKVGDPPVLSAVPGRTIP